MTRNSVRVPQIHSEIAVALAFLGWTPRQLAGYAELAGLPFGKSFVENALGESWRTYREKSDPVHADNLVRVLNGLGVELQDDVFGIVSRPCARVLPVSGAAGVEAVMMLTANFPKALLQIAAQEPVSGSAAPSLVLLMNLGDRFLLIDTLDVDPGELLGRLYADCLMRLSAVVQRIRSVTALSAGDALWNLCDAETRSAVHLSRSQAAAILHIEV